MDLIKKKKQMNSSFQIYVKLQGFGRQINIIQTWPYNSFLLYRGIKILGPAVINTHNIDLIKVGQLLPLHH